jgi:hypothetical protein
MSNGSKGRHRRPAGCRWRARWLFAADTALVTLAAGSEAMAATKGQRAKLAGLAGDGAR